MYLSVSLVEVQAVQMALNWAKQDKREAMTISRKNKSHFDVRQDIKTQFTAVTYYDIKFNTCLLLPKFKGISKQITIKCLKADVQLLQLFFNDLSQREPTSGDRTLKVYGFA